MTDVTDIEQQKKDLERQKNLYWKQLVDLKVAAIYMRCYRDYLGTWVTRIAMVRAIASSGSIAGWAIWKEFAFLWGMIIVLSQLIDALKDVFPFVKTFKAAGEQVATLSSLLLDALLEWENIFANKYTADEIMSRRFKLMKLQQEAENKNFPDGLKVRQGLFESAQEEARSYFLTTYNIETEEVV